MSSAAKWWSRATAAVSGAILTMVIPAYAWAASNGVDTLAVEAARGRRKGIGGLIFGVAGLCCLVVVGGIVFATVLMMKRRGKRPPH